MENPSPSGAKDSDPHLRTMLNSPLKYTPAVPVPDWNPSGSVPQSSNVVSFI